MKFLHILYFIFIASTLPAQTPEALKRENDSLRLELAVCQNYFSEVSAAAFKSRILSQIKEKSAIRYQAAQTVVQETAAFIQFCDSMRAELIERSGGMDPQTGQPVGIRDKNAANAYFFEEKKGAVLQQRIDVLHALYLQNIQNDPEFVPRITLVREELPEGTRANNWLEFKFKGMPLAAIMPMTGKWKSDATNSEAIVLMYLNR